MSFPCWVSSTALMALVPRSSPTRRTFEVAFIEVATLPVLPVDTVGAGDAFAGGVLYGLAHGYAADHAARWGNYLASRVVTIHGARLPSAVPSEVAKVLG